MFLTFQEEESGAQFPLHTSGVMNCCRRCSSSGNSSAEVERVSGAGAAAALLFLLAALLLLLSLLACERAGGTVYMAVSTALFARAY